MKKFFTKVVSVSIACMILLCMSVSAVTYQLNDNFDNQLFNGWSSVSTDPNQPVSISGTTGSNDQGWYKFVSRGSGYCLQVGLNNQANYWDSAAGTYKSRFEAVKSSLCANQYAIRTYTFEVKIPDSWDVTDTYKQDIFAQWHAGGGTGSPPIHFALDGNEFKINLAYNGYTYTEDFTNSSQAGDLRNKWQKFKVYVQWTYDDSSYGVVQVDRSVEGSSWVRLVDRTGINTINSGYQNYFKIGHYLGVGWDTRSTKNKVLYYDNVQVYTP